MSGSIETKIEQQLTALLEEKEILYERIKIVEAKIDLLRDLSQVDEKEKTEPKKPERVEPGIFSAVGGKYNGVGAFEVIKRILTEAGGGPLAYRELIQKMIAAGYDGSDRDYDKIRANIASLISRDKKSPHGIFGAAPQGHVVLIQR